MDHLKLQATLYLEDLLRRLSICENIAATLGPQMAVLSSADAFRAIGLLTEDESVAWGRRMNDSMDVLREKFGITPKQKKRRGAR